MKKKISVFILLIFCISFSFAQDDSNLNNRFKTYLSYYNSSKVAEGNNLVYVVTNGSLFSYNKTDNSESFYSRQTGMSDNDISQIAYNSSVNSLLIIYSNGNIDILNEDSNSIYNISHFLNNTTFNIKSVNNIDIYDDIAYLSMQFGVIALDMKKKEIKETYRIINDAVYSVSIMNNEIYATTVNGIYKALLDSNLADINNWKAYSVSLPDMTDNIIKTVLFDNKLCFLLQTQKKAIKGVCYQENDGSIKTLITNNSLINLKVENDKLITHTRTNAYIFSSFSTFDNINLGTVNDISSLKDKNKFWVAAGTDILKGINKNSAGTFDILLSKIEVNTPKTNYNYYMYMQGNKLLTTAGGKDHDRNWRQGIFSTYENNEWSSLNQSKLKYGSNNEFNSPQDFVAALPYPEDPSTYYIASYGEGLFIIKDNEFVNSYSFYNSPLEYTKSITEENYYYHYVRISSIAFDKNKNLWMTNAETEYPIKVLKPDSTWAKFSFKDYMTTPMIMDKIIITSKDHKWLNIPYSDSYNNNPGIFIFKDNDLSEEGSQATFISSIINQNGEDIGANTVRCMVEDKKGNIWIGTNKGPVYTTVPANALENPNRFFFYQIIREGESGAYLFLNGDLINAIAVDGGNQKWLGTESSGVFLVSEDGMETIYNFTTANSPLPSNKIESLTINDETGEVFIGTNKGLISFMGEGTEGKESFSDVSVYPNPVRPEYEDKVTITGLMTDSNVKITDIKGNLIYQAKSVGGQLLWNCRNVKGSRVATGIYLVIAASSEGSESVVSKIMVIK
ncbi:two-component regulator propeller domain-containing protein [Massilibacteroides sp.]|uniref:type IX secretion system anionic LPS delivery protein PorZ n=1 Tax=Massilibacteroides sp. TaxID=2034766 RepID=UPI0026109A18|nr:two-component regulator propeller domain-containing protein [Massilibacteroides sp.]MDD4514768.1 two-component regulator propeller domain-containing protein [Massilibacteroides sp.]